MTHIPTQSHTTPQSNISRVSLPQRDPPSSPGISALRNCLSCSNCKQAFNCLDKLPLTLACGHTICKSCTANLATCPLDATPTQLSDVDIQKVPVNYAILQLVMDLKGIDDSPLPGNFSQSTVTISPSTSSYHLTPSPEVDPDLALDRAKEYLDELSDYLVQGTGSTPVTPLVTPPHVSPAHPSMQMAAAQPHLLSRPLQRKLSSLSNCSISDEDGRTKLVRAVRSIGERCVNELIVIHQNPQMLTSHLWAAVRQRGCQFLGPQMQENTLQLIHFLLRDGEHLPRKSIVLFVVSRLEKFPSASKTNVGHVVQLLYRASCFNVTKRKDASSLLQLKEDYRQYEALRREHDAQIVQIAYEAGLRISPEQWSSLIYGDLHHKSHMQSIIDKLQTAQSFYNSIHELIATLKKSGDPMDLSSLKPSLELIASINTNTGERTKITWENLLTYLKSVCHIMEIFVQFLKVSSKSKNNYSGCVESSCNSPSQTRNNSQNETSLGKQSLTPNHPWDITPIGTSPSDFMQKKNSLSFESPDRYNSPLPEIASPFPYPSTVPIRASGYQHRGGMGSFPNYPTPVSPHTSLNNYSYNHDTCGIISPSQTQTRDTLSPYLGHQRIGRDANSTERDSPLFQMSPQPRTPSRPPLSAYQRPTNPSWAPRYTGKTPGAQLDINPPFSLPAKDSTDFADPYLQQQHRSLPEYRLAPGDRRDSYQRLPSLHMTQSSLNSSTSSELDAFPFLSPKPNLDLPAADKLIGEEQHIFNKYNLSALLSDINVNSPGSMYSSGYSSIHESPSEHMGLNADKPYRQEWIQVRCRELADKEVELNAREAYIKKKEHEYFMAPCSSDKLLQELFDKELAKELQKSEMPMQDYPTYCSDQDPLDPLLSQIITNLHIDN